MLLEVILFIGFLILIFIICEIVGSIMDKFGLVEYPEDEYRKIERRDKEFKPFMPTALKNNMKSNGKFNYNDAA